MSDLKKKFIKDSFKLWSEGPNYASVDYYKYIMIYALKNFRKIKIEDLMDDKSPYKDFPLNFDKKNEQQLG